MSPPPLLSQAAEDGEYGDTMTVDGVNKVRSDGRYQLPPDVAERYAGEYLAASDRGGEIVLTVVEDE